MNIKLIMPVLHGWSAVYIGVRKNVFRCTACLTVSRVINELSPGVFYLDIQLRSYLCALIAEGYSQSCIDFGKYIVSQSLDLSLACQWLESSPFLVPSKSKSNVNLCKLIMYSCDRRFSNFVWFVYCYWSKLLVYNPWQVIHFANFAALFPK
jgi:hypothetical protein